MDKRALKILVDTYWSSSGWHRNAQPPNEDDFSYAKARKMMFDPLEVDHQQTLDRLRALVDRLTPREVADGFLASLSTRRLDWRSAMGSYVVARNLPQHVGPEAGKGCAVCGVYEERADLNVLNFERHKWGGVRHTDPVYASLDLALFLDEPPPAPTAEDGRIFRDLMAALMTVPPALTSAALHKHFPSALKANKSERDQIVAILGLCGILGTQDHPGFSERYVPRAERALPDRHFVDMAYPACWWRGLDGVNSGRLQEFFGHVL